VTGSTARHVLAVNGGSSSIKFAVYAPGMPPVLQLAGRIERIGLADTSMIVETPGHTSPETIVLGTLDQQAATTHLLDWLNDQPALTDLGAIGHRVVNGGAGHGRPEKIDAALIARLQAIAGFAPEHLPAEIALIERFHRHFPDLPQIACFDTGFHRQMPVVARLLPIPRRYYRAGVERYGFHGLSYAFLLEELETLAGPKAANGRVIMAHIGNGVSLAAVKDGHSVDTSMAFSPAAGVAMGTRSGDLDPGLFWYLTGDGDMSPAAFHKMVNHESGLLGLSETSADLRDLLALEATDSRAAEAVALFCYQIRKCIGAYAAALGGVDTLIFAGGIGENASPIRERICAELGFLGIVLDPVRNGEGAGIISAPDAAVTVRVIATNEEIMIARAALAHLQTPQPPTSHHKDQPS